MKTLKIAHLGQSCEFKCQQNHLFGNNKAICIDSALPGKFKISTFSPYPRLYLMIGEYNNRGKYRLLKLKTCSKRCLLWNQILRCACSVVMLCWSNSKFQLGKHSALKMETCRLGPRHIFSAITVSTNKTESLSTIRVYQTVNLQYRAGDIATCC